MNAVKKPKMSAVDRRINEAMEQAVKRAIEATILHMSNLESDLADQLADVDDSVQGLQEQVNEMKYVDAALADEVKYVKDILEVIQGSHQRVLAKVGGVNGDSPSLVFAGKALEDEIQIAVNAALHAAGVFKPDPWNRAVNHIVNEDLKIAAGNKHEDRSGVERPSSQPTWYSPERIKELEEQAARVPGLEQALENVNALLRRIGAVVEEGVS